MKNVIFKRKRTLLSILIIIPLGFYTKFYSGPAAEWVHNSLGGVLYVIFWSLLIYLFARSAPAFKIALGVFMATCILEFLQLWQPPFLQEIRSHFLGRTLLGSSFSWWDIVHYGVGFVIAVIVLNYLIRSENTHLHK